MGDEASSDPYAPEIVTRLIARPGFRHSVEAAAAATLEAYASLDGDLRWVFRDRGRFSIALGVILLHHRGMLTAAALKTTVARVWHESSPGRVRAFLKRMSDSGHLKPERGATGKASRTLVPSERFVDVCRLYRLAVVVALTELDPAIVPLRAAVEGAEYPAVETFFCSVPMQRTDIFRSVPNEGVFFFFAREAGFTMLFDLMLSQPTERARLLESALLSVHGLAKRHGVSRAHVLHLLGEAQKQGWLTIDREKRRIDFSPAFSESVERYSALMFLLHREAWRQYGAAKELVP